MVEDHLTAALQAGGAILRKTHPIRKVRFLEGGRWDGDLMAQILMVKLNGEPKGPQKMIEDIIAGKNDFPAEEWSLFFDSFFGYHAFLRPTHLFGVFSSPFDKYCACGEVSFNLGHPFIQTLAKLYLLFGHDPRCKQLSASALGQLRDRLKNFWELFFEVKYHEAGVIVESFEQLIDAFEKANVKPLFQIPEVPTLDDFMPGSIRGGRFLSEPRWWSDPLVRPIGAIVKS